MSTVTESVAGAYYGPEYLYWRLDKYKYKIYIDKYINTHSLKHKETQELQEQQKPGPLLLVTGLTSLHLHTCPRACWPEAEFPVNHPAQK